ncbi:MAG TPA: site-specific integrase [Erysipelotrichaceae bacterium]|nr:site-specific integrase [Erysipelotrichaceae bacterium]
MDRILGYSSANKGTKKVKMPQKLEESNVKLPEVPHYEWTLEQGFAEFERFNKIKNLRPATIKDYREGFERFKKFYNERYPESKQCGNIIKHDIEDYILYLRGTGMRDTSVNTYLRNIRTWLNYLFENEACGHFKVPITKVDKQMKGSYTDDELRRLLVKPNMKTVSFAQYRNWVIVNFLLSTAVRASTLVALKNRDVDIVNRRIDLRITKSRKQNIIPLSSKMIEILVEYMNLRRGELEDTLFCDEFKDPMTYEGLKTAIRRYNSKMGVDKSSIHLFRHTSAKRAVMQGMNVFALQKMLGHNDLTVSREYVEMYSDDMAQGFDNFNALDSLDYEAPQAEVKTKIKMRRGK